MKTFTRSVLAWTCLLLAALSAHAGKVTYFHNDIAGSPLAATNESGQVVWRESYRPYGERLTKSALSKNNDVWFTSRRQDSTGLVYMGARYYDPVAGRFVSMDPKGFDEANVLSFGRYTYGNDNPYKYKDPDGKWAIFANESDGRDVRAEVQSDSTRAVFAGARDAVAKVGDAYTNAVLLLAGVETAVTARVASGGLLAAIRSGTREAALVSSEAAGGVVFKTAHYADRLRAAGLDVRATEAKVLTEVNAMRASMEVSADTAGRIRVGETTVEYRARVLDNGTVNIGTMFPVQ